MEKRVRISPAYRRQEDLLRQRVLSASLPFEKKLSYHRTRLVSSIAKGLAELPPIEWEGYVRDMVQEPYLQKWFTEMYWAAGRPAGERAIRNFLNIKSDPMDSWEWALQDWLKREAGNKIVIVQGSMKKWLVDYLRLYLDENSDLGVEQIVRNIEGDLIKQWEDARQWQIRRIVQTESLTAMSEAADVAIKGLGIKYNKTWGISGHNTREAHLAMDGITIGQLDLFDVGGEKMEYPRDAKYGATAANIINCRCYCIRKPLNDRGGLITDEDILGMV